MTAAVTETTAPLALHVPKELWIATLLAMFFSYLMFAENGALLTQNWEMVHEFFHDGRHIFGVPCH